MCKIFRMDPELWGQTTIFQMSMAHLQQAGTFLKKKNHMNLSFMASFIVLN